MDAAEVDAPDGLYSPHEPLHAADISGDQNSGTWIVGVSRVIANGRFDVGKENLHLRWNCHPIEILLPFTRGDEVVDKHHESRVERLAPADDDLSVNETVVDAVKVDAHQRPTTISEAFPRSAAARAASVGGTEVLNTKSSNVARLT